VVNSAAPKSEILMSLPPAAHQQDVGRLDVAVGDAEAVGVVERPRALEDDLDHAVQRQQVVGVQKGSSVPPATYSMTM
jgi:hypothetical protein